MNIGMRKFSGEIYDASTTIVAMGRQPEFDRLICGKFWERFNVAAVLGAFGQLLRHGSDAVWATVSMAIVISMRGKWLLQLQAQPAGRV